MKTNAFTRHSSRKGIGRFIPWMLALLALAIPASLAAQSMDAGTLADLLQGDQPPLLIDARSPTEYQKGNIPGAINIPLEALHNRQLPPVGLVVVYGDGLARVSGETAAQILRNRPGIEAWYLQGGYAGWITARGHTTTGGGLHDDQPQRITWRQLVESGVRDAVIQDVREIPDDPQDGFQPASGGDAVTEFAASLNLPLRRGNPLQSGSGFNPASGGDLPLLILIDNGDGRADRIARRLRSAGTHRVVVLVGGQTIIEHEGRPGLERITTGGVVEAPNPNETPSKEAP